MNKVLSILVIFFLSVNTYGQNEKTMNIPCKANGDTTYWFKWQKERATILMLPNIVSSTDNFHFRFWANGQTVDIWTQDYITFFGILTNYADTYEPYNSKKREIKPSTNFSNQVILDTSLARQSYLLIQSIHSIPSEDSIKGWANGCDGITYKFEISTPYYYSFKTYWTPKSQDTNLLEAKQIQKFVDEINSLLNLKVEYEKFFSTLKPGSYTSDSFMIRYKFTKKQIKYINKFKPYKEYLDSVKDTFKNYLSDTLNKIFKENNDLECYNQFYLKFSKNNKLIKIKTKNDFITFKDWMDCYKCRRKIRKAFKHVHIDFIHSKVGYWTELYSSNKKIKIKIVY
jgi:hypothetical protein